MTILILGGAGRTGARIHYRLATRAAPTQLASRQTGFNWSQPVTWSLAVQGVSAAYVCFSPDLAFSGVPEKMDVLGRLAARAGLERLVLLSGRGEEGARASEAALRAVSVPATVLRCSWFQQNFSEHFLSGPVHRGCPQLPAPDRPEAFLDLNDVADAAVPALMRTAPEDSTYELSGPELMTFTDVAAVLTQACGRNVVLQVVVVPIFVTDLATDGIPAEEGEPHGHLFTEILDGRNASLGDGIEQLLGRPASSFSSYVRAAATSGVWA